jgi:monovalent cation:H+ antiporter, CPA1 family
MAKYPYTWRVKRRMAVALVLSLSAKYEFKVLFISLIIPLIAINLVVNPILLNQYLKKSSIT